MHKFSKKLAIFALSTVMACGAVSAITGCGTNFETPNGIPTGDVTSNGGFVVEVGDYYYYINGVESYTSDNTYGEVVKGALMRVKKTTLANGGKGEIVVPSLMVADDYSAGIFVYGDRVYFATPNNVKNTNGKIENDYLDFKSAKLDGTDVQGYFRIPDKASSYRFVEVDGTVYVMYLEKAIIHSYNTKTKVDTVLANETKEVVFNSTDKTDPTVYYTVDVVDGIDQDNPQKLSYQQIYSVTADTVEGAYDYEYDTEKSTFVNLGTLVLDGVGTKSIVTEFTQDDATTALTPNGYTYKLASYNNDGIYFTRSEVVSTSSTGEGGWLYYLAESKVGATWNTVLGNGEENLDVVAQNTTYASEKAIFYVEGGVHHYLYVDGSAIYRADVGANGVATTQRIAQDVSGASLVSITDTDSYDYVWFSRTNGSGLSVERAVYNGTEENYLNINANSAYRSVKLLNVQHASGWYNFEVVGNNVFFVDSESLGANTFNYTAVVRLGNTQGNLMDNDEVKAYNDKYNEIVDAIAEVTKDDSALGNAEKCYFYTATDKYFKDNIKAAVEAGKKDTFLYTEETQNAFTAYVQANANNTRKNFIVEIGLRNETDKETNDTYWTTTLKNYTPTETESGLPAWAWAIIGVAIGVVVVGVGVACYFTVRAKKAKKDVKEKEPVMEVLTDVENTLPAYEEETTETTEEVTEEVAKETEEVATEEATEEVVEATETAEEDKPQV